MQYEQCERIETKKVRDKESEERKKERQRETERETERQRDRKRERKRERKRHLSMMALQKKHFLLLRRWRVMHRLQDRCYGMS